MILYVETNLLLSITTGREPQANTLLIDTPTSVQIAIPGICYMEALSVLEADLKYRRRFSSELSLRLSDAERNLTSHYAQSLAIHLKQARDQNNDLIEELRTRLLAALDQLAIKAEIISLSADIIQASLRTSLINEPTDNLILNCILNHARSHPTEVKVFLSGNTNDFGKQVVRAALDNAGVNQYFGNAQAFLSWQRSQLN